MFAVDLLIRGHRAFSLVDSGTHLISQTVWKGIDYLQHNASCTHTHTDRLYHSVSSELPCEMTLNFKEGEFS